MSDIARSGKEMASLFTGSLQDSEITEVAKIVGELQIKYGRMPVTAENLWALADEAKTRLHEKGYIVEVDIGPVWKGEPPIIDILGTPGNLGFQQQEHDHEKQRFEIIRSRNRGEFYLGEKEPVNSIPAKRRSREDHRRRQSSNSDEEVQSLPADKESE